MRGVQESTLDKIVDTGITPACAGSTHDHGILSPLLRDHPRVCGEYDVWDYERKSGMGSPPRVRGVQSVQDGVLL